MFQSLYLNLCIHFHLLVQTNYNAQIKVVYITNNAIRSD